MHGGDFQLESPNSHWMDFQEPLINGDDRKFYLTVTINLADNSVELFSSGLSIGKNECNNAYLDEDTICNEEIPFTVGVCVKGSQPATYFSNLQLYGCRLYDRVLSDEEIKQNYEQSKNLLND